MATEKLTSKDKSSILDDIGMAVVGCKALDIVMAVIDWAQGSFGANTMLASNPETQMMQSACPNIPLPSGHVWGTKGAQSRFRSIFRSDTAVDTISLRWKLGWNVILARLLPNRIALVSALALDEVPDQVLAQEFFHLLKDKDASIACVKLARAMSEFAHTITVKNEKTTRRVSRAVSFSATSVKSTQ